MSWPKKCPQCSYRGKKILTTRRTFSCGNCNYFIDNSVNPDRLEFRSFKKKEK